MSNTRRYFKPVFSFKVLWVIFLQIPICVVAQSWFTTGQDASLMISGIDFNQTGGALLMNHPNGLATNGTNLLVCDRFNNRILIWNTAPDTWNTAPDLVLGQPDFDSNNPGTQKSQLNWPGNASLAENGRLAVADTENDRLLLWNTFPTSNGQPADISISLPVISPPGTPQQWAWPWGIWTDGTRLAAIATLGGAILFWNTFPIADNQPPDYVIGNPAFGTPRNISTDGSTYFFVGDHNANVNGNPGTFFWNSYPSMADQPFDFYRDEWIKGTRLSNGQMIASGLSSIYTWDAVPVNESENPSQVAAPSCYNNGDGVDVVQAAGRIYVCNYNGNDVLVYNAPPSEADPDPAFAMTVEDFNHNSLEDMGYIQNAALTSDGTRLIISSDFDRRIYIYDSFPITSGQLADEVISTANYDLSAWDNALYDHTFVAAGKNKVAIWYNADNLQQNPSQIFNNHIGSANWTDLKGVALDSQFFYLADRAGKVFIWPGIPVNADVNPLYTMDFGNVQLNRLSSDGSYFCVTQQSPAKVFIYRISDLASGIWTPWKTINGIGFLNLPSETITFNGSLAIANMSFHDVLLWKDINDAPDTDSMIVLGQNSNSSVNPPGIGQDKLFMPGSLLYDGQHLWVGEHKFSSRILRYDACGFIPDLTGNLSVCANNVYVYSVPPIEGSTYIWTVTGGVILEGQGTNEITVLWDEGGIGVVDLYMLTP